MNKPTTTLYLAAGPDELLLARALDWRALAAPLDGQPLLRPALTQRYAEEMAAQWKVAVCGEGYVLAFDALDDVVAHYPEQTVGEPWQRELWVPAEDLLPLNRGIVGVIRVVRALKQRDTDVV